MLRLYVSGSKFPRVTGAFREGIVRDLRIITSFLKSESAGPRLV